MVLNGGAPIETGDAAGHLGVAEALVGHLRAFGYNASQGRIFLPHNVLAANGVNDKEVLAGQMSEGLGEALSQLAEMAGDHLDRARRAIAALPRPLRPAFAPVALIGPRLRRLALETPFQAAADMADWQKLGRMAWWALRA
jgi:phytoene synthase